MSNNGPIELVAGCRPANCRLWFERDVMSAEHRKAIRDALPVTGLLLLCFLWSLESLRSDLLPAQFAADLPPFEREAMHLGALAGVAWLMAAAQRAPWPRGRQIWDCDPHWPWASLWFPRCSARSPEMKFRT